MTDSNPIKKKAFKKKFFSPIMQKRISRFKKMPLPWFAFRLLLLLYLISLPAELICNSNPLYVRLNGKSYFPVLFFYTENTFLHNNKNTRPDYKEIAKSDVFTKNKENFMLFPFFPYGPYESIDPDSLDVPDRVEIEIEMERTTGRINLDQNFIIRRHKRAGRFFGVDDNKLKGIDIREYFNIPDELIKAMRLRLNNKPAKSAEFLLKHKNKDLTLAVSLSTFKKRAGSPKSVRLIISKNSEIRLVSEKFYFDSKLMPDNKSAWEKYPEEFRDAVTEQVQARFKMPVDRYLFKISDYLRYKVLFYKKEVRFPYPPVRAHIFGIDDAGRDVFARVLYGLRISMTFGIILVLASVFLGTVAGAVQGYYSGVLDITAQRLIEIWSAIPFLYVMILMGSIYGPGFLLLLFCYGIFNWIGISYYMRAEFLRLRGEPFVEAALCLGIPTRKIIFKHILPNALVPIITFFPFYLVGAIGSLAALDYLGFGLPPPTPSWGQLLTQAQTYRWAWWLILFPSLALFLVMLLGVFIGEGARNAFDPKPWSRLK